MDWVPAFTGKTEFWGGPRPLPYPGAGRAGSPLSYERVTRYIFIPVIGSGAAPARTCRITRTRPALAKVRNSVT